MEYNYAKKSLWKWILLYVVIGVVACGAIYYFFFYNKGGYSYAPQNYQTQTKNSSETVSWKTYANTEYGFEFNYPLDTFTQPAYENNKIALLDLAVGKNFNGADFFPAWVYVANSSDKTIFDKMDPGFAFGSKGTVSLNGIQWNTISYDIVPTGGRGMAGSDYIAYTQKDSFTYIFRCIDCNAGVSGEVGQQNKSVFDSVFSTFKFTK